jgi:nitrate reductase alpha subunit
MEPGAQAAGHDTELTLSLLITHDSVADVAFPYFGGNENPHFRSVKQDPVLTRRVPSKTLTLADGERSAWSAFTIWCWRTTVSIAVWRQQRRREL